MHQTNEAMRRTKKTMKLPVEPYIKNWLIYFHGYDHVLELTKFSTVMSPTNKDAVRRHFFERDGDDLVEINVCMYYPNYEKLYYLHNLLKKLFNYELVSYIKMATTILKVDAMSAMKDYLRKCNITEVELKVDTAYKRWQRHDDDDIVPGMKCA